ncbi:MAG: discoidin domain-containing protein [Nitrospirota bacterium]
MRIRPHRGRTCAARGANLTVSRFLLIASGITAAVGIRIAYVRTLPHRLDADEAMTGLMARHVLQGDFPVFFHGQAYMGSGEAYPTAALFFLFGASAKVLLVAPFILSVLFVVLAVRLAQALYGETAAVWTGAYAAAPPAFLAAYGLSPRLGYIETLVLGSLLLLLALKIREDARRGMHAAGRYAAFGVVAGLSVWTNFLIAPFLVVAVSLAAASGFRSLLGWPGLMLAGGVLVGGFPFWISNLQNEFWSFAVVGFGEGSLKQLAAQRFAERIPYLLGFRHISTETWLGWPGTVMAVSALVLFVAWIAGAVWGTTRGGETRTSDRRSAALIAFLITVSLGAYALNRFGYTGSPRYYFGFYVAAALVFGAGTAMVWNRSRTAGALIGCAVLLGNLVGLVLGYQALSDRESWEAKYPSVRPLIEFLEGVGVTRAYANHHISIRTTFASRERIVVAEPVYEPYAKYRSMVDLAEDAAFVFQGRSDHLATPEAFEENIKLLGGGYRKDVRGPYTIFHGFHPPGRGRSLRPSGWRVSSSNPESDARLAFDRSASSRWTTGRPRREGDWFEIDLGSRLAVQRIVLLPGGNRWDAPTGLWVKVSADGRSWTTVAETGYLLSGLRWYGSHPRRDLSGSVEVFVGGALARFVRLEHLGADPKWDWSIGEIFIERNAPPDRSSGRREAVWFSAMAEEAREKGATGESARRAERAVAADPEFEPAHRLQTVLGGMK